MPYSSSAKAVEVRGRGWGGSANNVAGPAGGGVPGLTQRSWLIRPSFIAFPSQIASPTIARPKATDAHRLAESLLGKSTWPRLRQPVFTGTVNVAEVESSFNHLSVTLRSIFSRLVSFAHRIECVGCRHRGNVALMARQVEVLSFPRRAN
jgi:hypothetical protein